MNPEVVYISWYMCLTNIRPAESAGFVNSKMSDIDLKILWIVLEHLIYVLKSILSDLTHEAWMNMNHKARVFIFLKHRSLFDPISILLNDVCGFLSNFLHR